MSRISRAVLLIFILAPCAAAAACRARSAGAPAEAPAGRPRVEVSGGIAADESADAGASLQIFEEQVRLHGAAGAARFAADFPDRAIRILRSGGVDPAARAALESAFVKNAGVRADAFVRLEKSREDALLLYWKNDVEAAAKMLAKLRDDARAENYQYLQFEAAVLLAEPSMRGAADGSAWRAAVAAGAGIDDAELWHRAIAAKPADAAWPAESGGLAAVYLQLGNLQLRRGAAAAALSEFVMAARAAAGDSQRALAELGQARALLALGRRGEAMSVAERPVIAANAGAARSALALRAVLYSDLDQLETARDLLLKSLEGGAWPGEAAARADLGTVYLRINDEARGLSELERAASMQRESGDWRGLAQTLLNISRYLKFKQRDASAQELEISQIARDHGVEFAR